MKFKKLNINKSLFAASLIAIGIVVICMVSACSAQVSKIEKSGYPNTIAENAVIADKYKDVSTEIANDAVKIYMGMAGIPHGSKNEAGLRMYIENWAKEQGFSPVEGPGGCMYFDVPATKGYENAPNIILQSHMDMVVTTVDEMANIPTDQVSVELVKDEQTGEVHSKDWKTSGGLDDGEGIGTILAIAKNKNIGHGPLRMLFTTTEEIGCAGSQYVPEEYLNADYLINIDGSRTGEVIVSSAGYMNADYHQTYKTEAIPPNYSCVEINVSDLIGGHSGQDIIKPRRGGSVVAKDILNIVESIDPNFKIASISCGNAYNALSKTADMKVAIDKDKIEELKSNIDGLIDNLKSECTEETDVKVRVSEVDPVLAIGNVDSKNIVKALTEIPNGLIKKSEIQADTPESSANIGFLTISEGNLRIGISARSNDQNYMETLKNTFADVSKKYNLNYEVTEDSVVPVWPTDGNNKLSKMYLSGLKEQANLEGYETIIHASVEPSRFVEKHPGMLAICIGSDVKDEHGTSETWYTKAVPVTVAGILYVFDHVQEL